MKPRRGLLASEHPQVRTKEPKGGWVKVQSSTAPLLSPSSSILSKGPRGCETVPVRQVPCPDATNRDGGEGSMLERNIEHHTSQPQRCNRRAFVPHGCRRISAHLTSSHISRARLGSGPLPSSAVFATLCGRDVPKRKGKGWSLESGLLQRDMRRHRPREQHPDTERCSPSCGPHVNHEPGTCVIIAQQCPKS